MWSLEFDAVFLENFLKLLHVWHPVKGQFAKNELIVHKDFEGARVYKALLDIIAQEKHHKSVKPG